jgi:hypothetical protein
MEPFVERPITVIGLHRSGTNFLEECLRRAIKATIECHNRDQGVWKHGFEFSKLPPNQFVIIHKHPVSWVDSIRRKELDLISTRRKNQDGRTSWHKDLRDRDGNLDLARLGSLWDAFYKWWTFRIPHAPIIRYETLIESEKATRAEIIKLCDSLGDKAGKFSIPKSVYQSNRFTSEKRKGYLNFEFDTSPEGAQVVLDYVSPALLKRFGYDNLCLRLP